MSECRERTRVIGVALTPAEYQAALDLSLEEGVRVEDMLRTWLVSKLKEKGTVT